MAGQCDVGCDAGGGGDAGDAAGAEAEVQAVCGQGGDEVAREGGEEDERDGGVVKVVVFFQRGDDGSVGGVVEAEIEEGLRRVSHAVGSCC